jgi:hypothetical protein
MLNPRCNEVTVAKPMHVPVGLIIVAIFGVLASIIVLLQL